MIGDRRNESILKEFEIATNQSLLISIKKRMRPLRSYTKKANQMEKMILQGMVNGKRKKGKPTTNG